jgi:Tol biopolymer transport system component
VGRVPGCNDDSSGPAAAVSSLQLTPDGRSLGYQSYCAEPFANLWTVAPDGTQLRRVTHVSAQETAPGWSPDGARIAYTRAEAVGLSCKGCPARVWVADAGGGNAKALTTADPDSSWDNDPSWSPDGTSVLYAHATVSSFGELHVVQAAGGPSRDLHVAGNYATWGPSRIAFVDSGANPAVLWTMAPDGTDKRRIASGLLYAPAWSRSGVLACLERKQTGAPALLEFAAQGTSRVVLPFADVRDLAWSPDGTRFAFAALAKNGATFDVYTLRTDGTGLERLTRNVDAFNVSWR